MKYLIIATFFFYASLATASQLKVANDKYKQLLSDPIVAPIYQQCQSKENETLANCVWDELSKNPDQKQLIVDKYFSDNSDVRYDPLTITTVDKKSSIAIKKLQEYMYNKLQEAFYGEAKETSSKKGIKLVDHEVFYSLYKNQISKNIITTISSYCIDAEPTRVGYIIKKDSEERKKTRQSNIDLLKEQTEDSKTSLAYQSWGNCLQSINSVCKLSQADIGTSEDKKYSKERACVVTNHLRQLRQNLIASEDIGKEFKDNVDSSGFNAPNVSIYSGSSTDGKSIDDLTSITSNEFINKSGYKKEVDREQAQLKECIDSDGKADICKQFLTNGKNKEELNIALVEYQLRSKLLSEKLKDMQDEELKKYLEREGRTQKEIERALASDENKAKIKEQINEEFNAEREAIKTQINKTIDKSTITDNPEDTAIVMDKYTKINDELSNQVENYKQLVHYNNIVSGFLSVTDSSTGEEVGSNVQSINREISDSAYGTEETDKERKPASSSYMEELSSKLGEMIKGKKNADTKHDSTPMDTETVNANIFELDISDDKEKTK